MDWVMLQTKHDYLPPFPHHPLIPPSPPPPPSTDDAGSGSSLDSKISPSILLIIVILAVIFFISGLLHLLVRYLLRPTAGRDPDDHGGGDDVTALQGQLQQLFHLHDAGVDQSFIDTLPVFFYKAVVGIGLDKDPFDCAVCLCEFDADDRLRLLPHCSHAFHLECIDTWLLSHSTCPLCRSSLLSDVSASPHGGCSPIVLVLESGGDSSREIGVSDAVERESSNLGVRGEENCESLANDASSQKTQGEIGAKEEEDVGPAPATETSEAKVVPVKLGKFRNVDFGEGSSGENSNIDQRRCFSMGSFEYVMDDKSLLQVAIMPPAKKPIVKKPSHRRLAMSECDYHSQREGFKGFGNAHIGRVITQKRESFSISKIWLRSKVEKKVPPPPSTEDGGSRRAFSFRLPQQQERRSKFGGSSRRTTASEFDVEVGSELGFDFAGSCNGVVSRAEEERPSFARRTMLWIVGRNHKVVSHV